MDATISGHLSSVVESPKLLGRGHMPAWASFTVDEACEKTGYSVQYLRRLIRLKKIKAEKFGQLYLIHAESLNNYIHEMKEADDARGGPRSKPKGGG